MKSLIDTTTPTEPILTEENIDDLLYAARTNDMDKFDSALVYVWTLRKTIGDEGLAMMSILLAAVDSETGNGVVHMAAGNGHVGEVIFYFASFFLFCIHHLDAFLWCLRRCDLGLGLIVREVDSIMFLVLSCVVPSKLVFNPGVLVRGQAYGVFL